MNAGGQRDFWRGQRVERTVDQEGLLRVLRHAKRRFRSHPGLLGIGIGTGFRRRFPAELPVPDREEACIQFFVARKRRRLNRRERLPGFLYSRWANGRVDFRAKIRTDVIEARWIESACGAGSFLDSSRRRGLITLIFRDRAQAAHPFYLLSCAHVAGDLRQSPPPHPWLSTRGARARLFARTLLNSTARGGEMDYDIALAKIASEALPLPALRVPGTRRRLKSFRPVCSLRQGLGVTAVLRNRTIHGTLDSLHLTAEVRFGNETLRVHNLFGVNARVEPGDSGGLVHADCRAAGIVVASSPSGWLWFQPLQPAVELLQSLAPFAFSVFPPETKSSKP